MDTRPTVLADLRQAILAGRNADGGWGYYTGKASRIEPTCWALLALGVDGAAPGGEFLARCQQPGGWLVEDSHWPVNIGFNALAAFTWWRHRELATDDGRGRLLAALVTSKGIQAPPLEGSDQDNRLQGWSWTDGTFSWVEPTAWGLLALAAARQAGAANAAADAREAEGERVLLNRACHQGGWNFGNAAVMNQDLRPYVPTTALALLALARRRDESAVSSGLAFLRAHWRDEQSAQALGLALICLDVMGDASETANAVDARLCDRTAETIAFGNWHGAAIARYALAARGRKHAFAL